METSRDARGFLRRLEDRIEELVSRDDRVSLAFSGGLMSTLLATVARKRCDLICLVAGTPASPDVRASNAAKQHFDFRVESVLLDREIVRRNLQEMRALNRTMSMNSLPTLMPVYAVLGRHPGAVLLSGFGTPKTDLSIRRMLRAWHVESPIMEAARGRNVSRSVLLEASISLGLPEEWARVAHRPPADGSGIGDLSED